MKVKDAIVGFLFWLGILVFAFFIMSVESLSMWVLLILAVLAWIAYVLIIFRDAARAKRHPTMWIPVQTDQGPIEVAVDGSNRIRPYNSYENHSIYDQYEKKED